jgi:hypothetical protein
MVKMLAGESSGGLGMRLTKSVCAPDWIIESSASLTVAWTRTLETIFRGA